MCNILFTYAKKGQITVNKVVIGTSISIFHGALYNGYVARDTRNIANTGWHVPSNTELSTLVTYLGGTTIAGQPLKEAGTTRWNSPNSYADNSSGFTATGTGYRTDTPGTFNNIGAETRIWSNTNIYSTVDYILQLLVGDDNATVTGTERRAGLTIRLVRDNATGYTEGDLYVGNDGTTYQTKTIGTQIWTTENLAETLYRNLEEIPLVTDATTWAGLTSGGRCFYNNNVSYGYSETQEVIDDNTEFIVTITGQRPVNPKIEEKTFSQDSPAVFTKLPYDTYVITEDSLTGYTLDSITPSSITLWGGNKADESVITNILD